MWADGSCPPLPIIAECPLPCVQPHGRASQEALPGRRFQVWLRSRNPNTKDLLTAPADSHGNCVDATFACHKYLSRAFVKHWCVCVCVCARAHTHTKQTWSCLYGVYILANRIECKQASTSKLIYFYVTFTLKLSSLKEHVIYR